MDTARCTICSSMRRTRPSTSGRRRTRRTRSVRCPTRRRILFAEFDRLHILQSEFFSENDNFLNMHKLSPDPQVKHEFESALNQSKALEAPSAQHPAGDPGNDVRGRDDARPGVGLLWVGRKAVPGGTGRDQTGADDGGKIVSRAAGLLRRLHRHGCGELSAESQARADALAAARHRRGNRPGRGHREGASHRGKGSLSFPVRPAFTGRGGLAR